MQNVCLLGIKLLIVGTSLDLISFGVSSEYSVGRCGMDRLKSTVLKASSELSGFFLCFEGQQRCQLLKLARLCLDRYGYWYSYNWNRNATAYSFVNL